MYAPIIASGQSNSKFLTLSVLPKTQPLLPVINTDYVNKESPLFNELYLSPIDFEPKKPPNIIDNKRVIPTNIEEWSTQNKLIKPVPQLKKPIPQKQKKEKAPKKQFIEIDLLYGDVDRMLILLRFCYPQLNNIPEDELRNEIGTFLKHLTRNRQNYITT